MRKTVHSTMPVTARSAWLLITGTGSRVAATDWNSRSYSISQMVSR